MFSVVHVISSKNLQALVRLSWYILLLNLSNAMKEAREKDKCVTDCLFG
jgi:hypothetical protein